MSRSNIPRLFRSTALCLFLLWTLLLAAAPRGYAQTDADKPKPEVATLIQQALQAGNANNFPEGVRLLNSALEKARQLNDAAGEAYATAYLGIHNASQSRFVAALPQLEKSLQFFQDRNIKVMQIVVMALLAESYRQSSQADKALELADKVIALSTEPDYARAKSAALIMQGQIYADREAWPQVVAAYEAALPYLESAGDKEQFSLALGWAAFGSMQMGEYLKAMQFSQRALQARKGVKAPLGEALALTSLTGVYADTGQYERSLTLADEAIAAWRKMGVTRIITRMHVVLGEIYRRQHQPQTALKYLNQALPPLRKEGERSGLAYCLVSIGGAYRELRQPGKSLPYYAEAAELQRLEKDEKEEGEALNYQGQVYQAMGQPARAREMFEKALVVLNRALASPKVTIDQIEEADVLYNIAIAEEEMGRLSEAAAHLDTAVIKAERVRSALGGLTDLKIGLTERILYGFQRYVGLLLKSDRTSEAFALVQRTKARGLLDLMAGGKVDIHRSLTPEQSRREQDLRLSADRLNTAMVREGVVNAIGSKRRFEALKQQLAQAERELLSYQESLYALHPELAQKRIAKTVTLEDAARFLPDDTALLEFATLNAKEFPDMSGADQTVLFVVTRESGAAKLNLFPVAVPRAALGRQVEAFQAACADPRKTYMLEAQKLYDLLIRPAEPALQGKKRLILCPDGPLWGLPFAVLHDRKEFLLQRYELAYAYSASGAQAALQERQERPGRKTLLALGNPDFGGEERFGDKPGVPGAAADWSGLAPNWGGFKTNGQGSKAHWRGITSCRRRLAAHRRGFETYSRSFASYWSGITPHRRGVTRCAGAAGRPDHHAAGDAA